MSMDPDYTSELRPVAEVIGGLEIMPLPPGYQPMEAVVLVKSLDEDGHVCWVQRWTQGLHLIEVLGASTAMARLNERDAVDMYAPEVD